MYQPKRITIDEAPVQLVVNCWHSSSYWAWVCLVVVDIDYYSWLVFGLEMLAGFDCCAANWLLCIDEIIMLKICRESMLGTTCDILVSDG